VKAILRHTGRAVAAIVLPAGLLARLGLPALAALVFLVVLALAAGCWIISNDGRSDRLTRMILARRGDARCLKVGTSSPRPPANRR
jgi:hypothetical protein